MRDKPWIAWVLVAGIAAAAAIMLVRFTSTSNPTDVDYLAQEVTVRCSETGDEWTVARGRLERELLLRGAPIDPAVGLVNPKTGRPTGFPVDRDEWNRTIQRLNNEAREAGTLKKGGS